MPEEIKKVVGITEIEFRAKHDNMFKIREGCKKLQKGRYLTDPQMREHCQVPSNTWRAFAENPEFDKFKISMPGKITYWGSPDNIEKLRRDLNVA
jgi:hypothetical protein